MSTDATTLSEQVVIDVNQAQQPEDVAPNNSGTTITSTDNDLDLTSSEHSDSQTLEFSRAPPVLLQWKDIEYSVRVRKPKSIRREDKTILHKLNGVVEPGTLLAIMGPSGCGKTSLLNILSQRVNKYHGEVTVNGSKVTRKSIRSVVAVVPQDDVLLPNLTVWETLRFHAMLKIPSKYSFKQKMQRAREVVSELGLEDCIKTYVGSPGVKKGISGGERKRLSLGIELLTQPSILFLDEPTTGLDSTSALNLMYTLQKLTQSGRTVIMTIHQPSSNIFALFDKLLLMVRGKVCYMGQAKAAIRHFESLGYTMPENFNPADFLMDCISANKRNQKADHENTKEKEVERVDKIVESWKEPTEQPDITKEMKETNLRKYTGYPNNIFSQTFVILWRTLLNVYRDKEITLVRLAQTVFIAVLLGLIFLRLGKDQRGVQNRGGVLYFITINKMFDAVTASLALFQNESAVFMRERAAREYSVFSYYFAKNVSELPMCFIFPVIFGCIVYWMVGLNSNFARFLLFLAILIAIDITAQAFGQMISALVNSYQLAQTLATVTLVILILFGGFFINADSLPSYTIWVYWISPFHYGFEALFLNEFKGQTFTCSANEVCQFRTGEEAIRFYGLDKALSTVYLDVIMLLTLALVAKIVAFFGILILKRPRNGA